MNNAICIPGDCLALLQEMPSSFVDSVVTDPPYGLGFMGKAWDALPPGREVFEQLLRVLKPGGHLIAFGGTRTYHRLACAVEDGGFEIRDQLAWVYGTGFPKSLDVSKAIDKAAGAERKVPGVGAARCSYLERGEPCRGHGDERAQERMTFHSPSTAPATPEAQQWEGWRTALKPAYEPAVLARKPLIGTVAENVLAHGTGAMNIDGCRLETCAPSFADKREDRIQQGRFPANLMHDGSPEVLKVFPETSSGSRKAGVYEIAGGRGRFGEFGEGPMPEIVGDSGSAARFFYCAKASKKDRTEAGRVDNRHPTVKPTDLMRYLVRLVTPPGGVVLDPFMGSGSTGKAALLEGFEFVGIERDPQYIQIAEARLKEIGR